MTIAYYYNGNKEHIKQLLDYDLTILIDNETYVRDLIEFNCAKKIIKYNNMCYDILISLTDNIESVSALKKVVIGIYKEHKPKIKYLNEFNLEEIFKKEPKKDYKFSIIIPNYNNSEWIDKTIESVINQTYTNWEMYIIDDMSTDNSIEVINKYYLDLVDKGKNFELIQNKIKLYNGGSRNVGILKAKESNPDGYILFLDSDDYWDNNKFLQDLNDFIEDEDLITYEYKWYRNGKIEPAGHFTYKNADDLFMTNGICCACWCKAVKTELMPLFSFNTLMEDRVHWYRTMNRIKTYAHFCKYQVYVWNKMNIKSVTTAKEQKYGNELQTPITWASCSFRHIADQLDLLNELTNPKWIAFINSRINACKSKVNSGVFEQY